MYNEYIPERITELKANEFFVFGSNHEGAQGGVETIKPYVDEFYGFAVKHPEYKFLVTRIGCGIAGFTLEEIVPLFTSVIELNNIVLPKDFVEIIQEKNSWMDSFDYWADRSLENF